MVEHNYIDFESGGDSNGLRMEHHSHTGSRDIIATLREFCRTWTRAVKTICLYPAINPLPEEFRVKFFDSLANLVDEWGTVTLTTFDGGFAYNGETIWEDSCERESLPYLLFRDGIREIAFRPGIRRDESDRFLAALAAAVAVDGRDVDVANELWELGLESIKHFTVDRVVEGVYIDTVDTPTLEKVHRNFIGTGTDDEGSGGGQPSWDSAAVDDGPYDGVQRKRFRHVLSVFGDVTELTIEEKLHVASLTNELNDQSHETLGIEVLEEILRSCDDARTAEEALAALKRQIEFATDAGRWDLTHAILSMWDAIEVDAKQDIKKRIRDVRLRVSQRQHFERLAHYLNTHPLTDLDAVASLLPLYGVEAVMPITAMLGLLEHRPSRQMVCDFLAQQGRDTIDLIGGFIYDRRWYVVRNVAMVLGEIGHERALSFLRRSASHNDVRVRLETLRALQKTSGPTTWEILRSFLNDPEADLRKRSLHILGHIKNETVQDAIRAQVTASRNLLHRDAQELRELFAAHARLSGEQAVTDLVQLARRRRIWDRARWRVVRVAAVHALADSSAPEARQQLEAMTKSRNKTLAQASAVALIYRPISATHPGTHDTFGQDELS